MTVCHHSFAKKDWPKVGGFLRASDFVALHRNNRRRRLMRLAGEEPWSVRLPHFMLHARIRHERVAPNGEAELARGKETAHARALPLMPD